MGDGSVSLNFVRWLLADNRQIAAQRFLKTEVERLDDDGVTDRDFENVLDLEKS